MMREIALFSGLFVACGAPVDPPAPSPEPAVVTLEITSITPSSVDDEGGWSVTIATQHGCTAEDALVTVGGVQVHVSSPGPDSMVFEPPPLVTAPCFNPVSA
jgi:hypothetical protein